MTIFALRWGRRAASFGMLLASAGLGLGACADSSSGGSDGAGGADIPAPIAVPTANGSGNDENALTGQPNGVTPPAHGGNTAVPPTDTQTPGGGDPSGMDTLPPTTVEMGGGAGMGGADMGGDTTPPVTVMTASDPIIPPVTGSCPNFATGRFSFGGLSGQMDVGPKANGTGSLLFYWHGTGGSASNYSGLFGGIGSGNIQKIKSAGGIIVAVQGATGSGDALCSGTAVFDGDFSVIDQIVACAVQEHDIDPHRIYATGCSAGGLQSGCMAMRRSDYVAAVAPNSGGLVLPMQPAGTTGHMPASMTMHGGAGDNVGINFGDSSRTFNTVVTGGGGFAVDCNHNSGHCGAPGALYDAAIDFLLAHPFGVEPEPYTSGLPAGFPSYCQIVQ